MSNHRNPINSRKSSAKADAAASPHRQSYRQTLHEDRPTAFARLVVRRLNERRMSATELTERVYEAEGRTAHPGTSGITSNVLNGKKPPSSLGGPGAWVKALGLEPASREGREMIAAYNEHQLWCVTGRQGGQGETLVKQLATARDTIRRLELDLARVNSENLVLRTEFEMARTRAPAPRNPPRHRP